MNLQDAVSYEEALQLFELSPGICCVVGADGRIEYANPAAERILKYGCDAIRQISILDLVHPEDRRSFEKALRNPTSGSAGPEFETRFRGADGEYKWLLWNIVLIDTRIFGFAHDITEFRRQQEQRYRRLFESAKDAIVVIDASEGDILDCNHETEELLGYDVEQLRQQKIWDAAPFRAGGLGKRMFEVLKHSEMYRIEEELDTRSRGSIYCELLCNRYEDAGATLIQANIRDISERKRNEVALRDSEERFRMLVDGVQDYAIFLMDTRGKVTSWNPGAERILKYHESEILGRDSFIIFTPEDRARGESTREIETAIREGRAEDERWHLRKDGTRFFASGVLTALWRPNGELRGFAKVMRDITERKINEEAMQEAQKLESIGLLAGGIAHDFNNLLTGIIGSASLAAQDLPKGNPVRRLIEDVITAGKRAADLTRQLLAYAGKGRFTISIFDISAAVSEIVQLIHSSIPDTVRLEMDLQKGLPSIEADPSQVQQIAMNLVINAAEAIEGHGVIRVSTGRVQLGTEFVSGEGLNHLKPGEYVVLQVQDSGVGMDEQVKARIFDPFFTTKFTGRGLGLAAVGGIVRGHGGAIQLATAPRQGSTFRVFLPAVQQEPEPVKAVESGTPMRSTGTILVVDDDPIVRRVSKEALERRGYRVLTADNGKQAVEVFREHGSEIVLVVLDLAMPIMSGEDAHREIKAIRPDVPVLVSSGYSEVIAYNRFNGQGMGAFIQKPYTAAGLAERVQKMLSEAHQLKEQ